MMWKKCKNGNKRCQLPKSLLLIGRRFSTLWVHINTCGPGILDKIPSPKIRSSSLQTDFDRYIAPRNVRALRIVNLQLTKLQNDERWGDQTSSHRMGQFHCDLAEEGRIATISRGLPKTECNYRAELITYSKNGLMYWCFGWSSNHFYGGRQFWVLANLSWRKSHREECGYE